MTVRSKQPLQHRSCNVLDFIFVRDERERVDGRPVDQDIDLGSHTISTVQEFIVRQTLQPYLNPWFTVSGELRRHEEMRERADSILREYIRTRRQEEPGRRDQLGTPSPPEPQGSRGGARLAARTQVADGHRKVLRVAVDPAGRPGTPGHAWTRLGMAAMNSVSSR